MKKTMFEEFKSRKPRVRRTVLVVRDAFKVNGEIAGEDADRAMLYAIAPELECECDEFHTCQSCYERDKLSGQ